MIIRLAAMLAIACWPAAAVGQAPAELEVRRGTAAGLDRDISRAGEWMKQVSDATAVFMAAFAAMDAKTAQLFSGPPDVDRLKADAVAMRAALAEARTEVLRGAAMLDAIKPPAAGAARAIGFDTDVILADARSTSKQMLDLLTEIDLLTAHLERGDTDAVEAAAPRVMRSTFLIFESQRLQMRNRQLMTPPSSSTNKVVGIMVGLYQAMGVVGNSWYKAAVEGETEAAVREQRQQLLTIAAELDTIAQQGRDYLGFELAALAPERQRVKPDAAGRAVLQRAGDLLRNSEKIFLLGDELAALLRQRAQVDPADLAAQEYPQLLEQLVPFEDRLQEITRQHAIQMSSGTP